MIDSNTNILIIILSVNGLTIQLKSREYGTEKEPKTEPDVFYKKLSLTMKTYLKYKLKTEK